MTTPTLEQMRERGAQDGTVPFAWFEGVVELLWEAHDQLCGCDHPTNPSRCSAPEETWGAFEYLGRRERVSIPARES